MDRFLICLPFTLAQECSFSNDWSNPKNFSDDAHDPGGATMCGITQREYDLWNKSHGLPTQDVRRMTAGEGQAIYRAGYWLPHCPALQAGPDLFFFDTSVNMGSHRAVLLLQASLGVEVDGDWGPVTTQAVSGCKDWAAAIKDEENRRAAVYRSFGTFRWFGIDWIKRDQEIGAEALKMVGT